MGPQGTGPADSVAPGMLSASLAPSSHIGMLLTSMLLGLLPKRCRWWSTTKHSVPWFSPPLPLAPPGLVAAEICTNGGDTHFLEGTAEQVVVLIDDLDDCAQWCQQRDGRRWPPSPPVTTRNALLCPKARTSTSPRPPRWRRQTNSSPRRSKLPKHSRVHWRMFSPTQNNTPARPPPPLLHVADATQCRQVTPRLQRSCRRS